MKKTIQLHLWVASFEHGWGTRFSRSFEKIYYDYEPTREEAAADLAKIVHPPIPLDWFDNGGPCSLRQTVIEVYSK